MLRTSPKIKIATPPLPDLWPSLLSISSRACLFPCPMPQCYLAERLVEEGTGGSSGQSGPDVLSSPCASQQQSGCVLLSHRTEEVLKPLLPRCISGCRDGSQTSFTAAKSGRSYAQPLFTRDLRWRWSLFHSRIPWAHSITSKAIRLSDVSSSTRPGGLTHPGLRSL